MSIVNKWREVVEGMSKNGSWYCSGTVCSPFLEVNNEKVSYPFNTAAIKTMKSVAQPAPFGKGTETVVDEAVRKGLQIEPALVNFCNAESWQRKLDSISQELRNAYQRDNMTLTLYKMLLYEEGGHFASHKDTLRDKTHIASLLISLPVEGGCEGGVLRVSGPGGTKEVMEWDGRCDDCDAQWCSFYTDCQHELTPLTKGKRVVLAYQVYSDDGGKTNTTDADAYAVADNQDVSIADVVDCALSHKENALILLQHQYPAGCEAKHLKGFDRVLLELLRRNYKNRYDVTVAGLTLNVSKNTYDGGDGSIDSIELNTDTIIPNAVQFDPNMEKDEGDFGIFSCYKWDVRRFFSADPIQYTDKQDKKGSRKASAATGKAAAVAKKSKKAGEEKEEEELVEDLEEDYKEDNNDEDDGEYEDDEKNRLHSKYFSSPRFAFLFNTDDFEARTMFSERSAVDYTGNEAAPEELTYKFYAVALSKMEVKE